MWHHRLPHTPKSLDSPPFPISRNARRRMWSPRFAGLWRCFAIQHEECGLHPSRPESSEGEQEISQIECYIGTGHKQVQQHGHLKIECLGKPTSPEKGFGENHSPIPSCQAPFQPTFRSKLDHRRGSEQNSVAGRFGCPQQMRTSTCQNTSISTTFPSWPMSIRRLDQRLGSGEWLGTVIHMASGNRCHLIQ